VISILNHKISILKCPTEKSANAMMNTVFLTKNGQ